MTVGLRFGRLLVIGLCAKEKKGNTYFDRCLCDCGATKIIRRSSLQSGRTRSCGCLRQEVVTRLGAKAFVDGRSKHPLYLIWRSMIQRCEKPNAPQFKYYGARGIRVCDRWRHSFFAFAADMGPRPAGRQLGRIDPDGAYSPENVRWQDARTQKRDRAQHGPAYQQRRISWNGNDYSLSDLAAIAGTQYRTLYKLLIIKK